MSLSVATMLMKMIIDPWLETNREVLKRLEALKKYAHLKNYPCHENWAAQFRKKTASVPKNIPHGLLYEKVSGDGNCFFYAVGKYLKEAVTEMRKKVADYMEANIEELLSFASVDEATFKVHIANIRDGKEMADHLEIEVLQRVTDCPIIILRSDDQHVIPDNIEKYKKAPIFVYYYPDLIHYDALILSSEPSVDAKNILDELQKELATKKLHR